MISFRSIPDDKIPLALDEDLKKEDATLKSVVSLCDYYLFVPKAAAVAQLLAPNILVTIGNIAAQAGAIPIGQIREDAMIGIAHIYTELNIRPYQKKWRCEIL